jgi:hypothetical protein
MAFHIGQNLTISIGPFGRKAIDKLILEMVEKKLGRPVDWVDYTLVKEDKFKCTRTYKIHRACTYRDKDTTPRPVVRKKKNGPPHR